MVRTAETRRDTFVAQHLEARGIRAPLVLAAMRAVPREIFVPDALKRDAYEDRPLPIGAGQTISQPYIVAYMIAALCLRGGEKALEIGAGSGYAAAVLGQIAGTVFTIERISELAVRAVSNIAAAGCDTIHVRHADGSAGWAEEAPFDAILVSASAAEVPKALLRQLAIVACMVVPVGRESCSQKLLRITRIDEDTFAREHLIDVRFVPLIAEED